MNREDKKLLKTVEAIALFLAQIRDQLSGIKKILDKDEKKANTIEDDQNKE